MMVRSGRIPPVAQSFSLAMSSTGRRPARALVGQGRVHVPVGDDDAAAFQRGGDDRGDVLRAIGCVQQGLGPPRKPGVRGVEEQRAQPHADLRGPGLVRGDHVEALVAEPDREQPGLGGLARALAALQGQQQAAADRLGGLRVGGGLAGHRPEVLAAQHRGQVGAAAARRGGRPSAGRR